MLALRITERVYSDAQLPNYEQIEHTDAQEAEPGANHTKLKRIVIYRPDVG